MSFQQGLSGLNSSAKALDVISNNVANTSTVGFKSATAQFADVYAASLTGSVSRIQIGLGSTVNSVRQTFSQGNLSTTNNPLDLALSGNGFFIIERIDGTTAYTRNGQFDIDKDGFIVNALGEKVMGNQATDGAVPSSGGTPVPISIPPGGISPQATDTARVQANLDSRALSPAEQVPPILTGFDQNNPDTFNSTTSLQVFDSQGNDHTLTLYFAREPAATAPNTWRVFASLDGATATELSAGGGAPALAFNASGVLPTALPAFTFSPTLTNGAVSPFNIGINLNSFTQFGSAFSVSELNQNGFAPGEVAGLSIGRDGLIEGRYTNGQSQVLGQLVLATFRNPNGLTSLGGNLWAATSESGLPIPGKPGTGLNGLITSGSVEESNVELTQELVQLIIQQRNYQANAQSIQAQDQVLQTLVNL